MMADAEMNRDLARRRLAALGLGHEQAARDISHEMVWRNRGMAWAASRARCKRWGKRRDRGALGRDDFDQEGMIGLMIAVEKYDPDRGPNFSTCAFQWIRQRIVRQGENHGNAIRVPAHMQSRSTHTEGLRGYEALREAAGRALSMESLDPSLPMPDRSGPTGLDIDDREALARVLTAIGHIDEGQARVLTLRYGLDGGGERTYRAVGAMLGVTDSAIQQCEARAIKAVRRQLGIIHLESKRG